MRTTIQKWGHSNAVRIPKSVVEDTDLRENDIVEIKAEKDRIIIKRTGSGYKTLEERIAGYTGKYACGEWNTGGAKGKEIW